MIRKVRKLLIICLAVIVTAVPSQVLAIDKIDLDEPVSLTITTAMPAIDDPGPSALAGMSLELYKIADTNEWAEFTLAGDFADYNVKVNGLDSEGWRDLAQTLTGYADRDNIPSLASGALSESGNIDFGKLTPGLYLINGDEFSAGTTVFSPTPFVVCLPSRSAENGAWDYTVQVAMKMEVRIIEHETTEISVHKVWKDEGFEELRPESVTAQLLRDGEIYDEVQLSEENNWRYTWDALDAEHQYNVTELNIDFYEVSVSSEEDCFVITNALPESGTEEDEGGDKPYDEEGSKPEEPSEPGNPEQDQDAEKEGDEKLPQTGVLWWPVPVMIAAGLLLIIAGILRRRGAESEN